MKDYYGCVSGYQQQERVLVKGYINTLSHIGGICMAIWAFLRLEQDIESEEERGCWKGKEAMVADKCDT